MYCWHYVPLHHSPANSMTAPWFIIRRFHIQNCAYVNWKGKIWFLHGSCLPRQELYEWTKMFFFRWATHDHWPVTTRVNSRSIVVLSDRLSFSFLSVRLSFCLFVRLIIIIFILPVLLQLFVCLDLFLYYGSKKCLPILYSNHIKWVTTSWTYSMCIAPLLWTDCPFYSISRSNWIGNVCSWQCVSIWGYETRDVKRRERGRQRQRERERKRWKYA